MPITKCLISVSSSVGRLLGRRRASLPPRLSPSPGSGSGVGIASSSLSARPRRSRCGKGATLALPTCPERIQCPRRHRSHRCLRVHSAVGGDAGHVAELIMFMATLTPQPSRNFRLRKRRQVSLLEPPLFPISGRTDHQDGVVFWTVFSRTDLDCASCGLMGSSMIMMSPPRPVSVPPTGQPISAFRGAHLRLGVLGLVDTGSSEKPVGTNQSA
jgi:hypothetical protein